MPSYLTARDASARLQVSRATLYAYVSRGLIRSRARNGSTAREYSIEDVERLTKQKSGRRDPSLVARRALAIDGLPVLESALTLIEAGRLYYRGKDAIALSREATFEAVAAALWAGPFEFRSDLHRPSQREREHLDTLPFAAAGQRHLAAAAHRDRQADGSEPEQVRRTGARILGELTGLACRFEGSGPSVARNLSRAWKVPRSIGPKPLEVALILCADHELNVSAFTARAIASAGANLYMAIAGALAALSGQRHGGVTARVWDWLEEPGEPEALLARRASAGEALPGFGHPLYPDGDPRAVRLMETCPDVPARARALALSRAVHERTGLLPNIDFALATLGRCLKLPRRAPFTLFALGRTAGWVAHCLEQYATGELIRPRARYVGVAPEAGR